MSDRPDRDLHSVTHELCERGPGPQPPTKAGRHPIASCGSTILGHRIILAAGAGVGGRHGRHAALVDMPGHGRGQVMVSIKHRGQPGLLTAAEQR
jgi:hypothetical protein